MDGWWYNHWEMVVWVITALVVAIIAIGKLILQQYSTKHFVKIAVHSSSEELCKKLHECRTQEKAIDDDIVRRQERCATDLHVCINRLSDQIDKMYIMIMDIHLSGTDRDRADKESLKDWPKS